MHAHILLCGQITREQAQSFCHSKSVRIWEVKLPLGFGAGGTRWWHINSCPPPPPFSPHPKLPFSLYFPSHKNFDDNFMLPFLKPLAHRHHPSGVFSSASCLIFFLLFQGNRQTLRRQALDYFLPSVVDKSLSSEVQVAD